MNTQNFPVTGMSCNSCVKKIQHRLSEHPAVSEARVTLEPPIARVTSAESLDYSLLDQWLRPLGDYHITGGPHASPAVAPSTTYRPILLLLAYLGLVVIATIMAHGHWNGMLAMRLFMGGFFVAFSFFKMLDLRGFADAYRSYDLLARPLPAYGFIYPFIELAIGLAYLANVQPRLVNGITAVVMAISLSGVVRSLWSGKAIRCACLGTGFNLPMSTVTVVEDGVMLGMALLTFIV